MYLGLFNSIKERACYSGPPANGLTSTLTDFVSSCPTLYEYDTIEKLTIQLFVALVNTTTSYSTWRSNIARKAEVDLGGNMGIIISTLFEIIIYATNFLPFSIFFLRSGIQASRSFCSSAESSPIG